MGLQASPSIDWFDRVKRASVADHYSIHHPTPDARGPDVVATCVATYVVTRGVRGVVSHHRTKAPSYIH